MFETQTIVAQLTPPGRGALATIAVRGPRAHELVNDCLTKPVAFTPAARPWLRHFRSSEHATEELVVAFPSADQARVHCHGGLAACEAVIAALVTHGATKVSPAEWSESLVDSPLVYAAKQLLPKTLTERTAIVLLDQANGAMSRAIDEIVNLIQDDAAPTATQQLHSLLKQASFGRHLTEAWRVVIAGKPNAGKSSLLNALLGFQRSITSPLPGTTRDVVTANTAFAGWPIELRDTAGLRDSDDPLESIGVERAQREIEDADLVLSLVPADEPPADADRLFMSASANTRLIRVLSKADRLASPPDPNLIAVSVVTGAGLDQLAQQISIALVPEPPDAETAVPITPQQVAALEEALDALRRCDSALALQTLEALQRTGKS